MERRLEPELMLDPEQAQAYAQADFEDAHGRFVPLFREAFPLSQLNGCVLDLGCGPADISIRFAQAFPNCTVHGLDGSPAMLELGRREVAARGLDDRVTLIEGRVPTAQLPRNNYDAVIGNSILHHLPEASVLWKFILKWAKVGAPVFMMDLYRPESLERARELVEIYSGKESPILKKDFFHSLQAAYLPADIEAGLQKLGWNDFSLRRVSDRHLIVYGLRP